MAEAREGHLAVTRTARYWTLGESAGPREVWFVLHGYKQLARRFLRRFEAIAGADRLVVAPEALSRFYVSSGGGRHGSGSVVGASWMTREDRLTEIADYVGYLDDLADHVLAEIRGEPRITVLGFSQGVATASRWLTRGRRSADRVVLWGDFLPPDLDMERAVAALGGTDVVLVRGSEDRALDPDLAEAESRRLEAVGWVPRRVAYGGGHDIDEATLQELAAEP